MLSKKAHDFSRQTAGSMSAEHHLHAIKLHKAAAERAFSRGDSSTGSLHSRIASQHENIASHVRAGKTRAMFASGDAAGRQGEFHRLYGGEPGHGFARASNVKVPASRSSRPTKSPAGRGVRMDSEGAHYRVRQGTFSNVPAKSAGSKGKDGITRYEPGQGPRRVFTPNSGPSLSAKTASGREQMRAQGKPVGQPQVVIGPQGGVYERGKSGKLHSAGPAVRAARGGGRRK